MHIHTCAYTFTLQFQARNSETEITVVPLCLYDLPRFQHKHFYNDSRFYALFAREVFK